MNRIRSDSALVSFQGNTFPPDGLLLAILQCVTHVPGLCVTYLSGLYREVRAEIELVARKSVICIRDCDVVFVKKQYRAIEVDEALEDDQIDIGPGVTTVRVVVTSQDQRGINTYTVNMTYEDLLVRYDSNGDGAIDRDEADEAVQD